ncbi:hypothetical protein BDV18DRAFT_156475 [Aspergillus unguis]
MDNIIAPEKKRRRPKVSCTICRRRKVRCNREFPCSNCLRSNPEACVYEASSPSANHRGSANYPTPESHDGVSVDSSVTKSLSERSLGAETEQLNLRIRQLESQLKNMPLKQKSQSNSDLETTSHPLVGTFHLLYRKEQPQPVVQSLSMKSRLFGQSHWVVSVAYFLRDFMSTLHLYIRDMPDAFTGIEKCKTLARRIKAQQAPSWPPLLTSELPSRIVADALVNQYLRTTESLYRILHIPTFCRKYEKLWEPTENDVDFDFIVQLKLVLALGAITYDDQFSLRTSAIQWIYEAQIWVSGPKYKARMNIQAVQTNLLLLLAQDQIGVGGESSWVSAGALLRKAIFMGLHRDPSNLPERTVLATEMHRRLWNTILEMNLHFSLAYGGAPLLCLDDFDTAPPSNFDDEQLETETRDQSPKPNEQMTQMSFARALRRTVAQRLAILKFLNDLSSHQSYEETLRLDADLRHAYKELSQTLRASGSSALGFETQMIDSLMQRYFSALHIPYFGLAHGTAYAFSRASVVESSLRIWRAACPFSFAESTNAANDGDNILPRLMTCSSGYYPSTIVHAAFVIAIEIRNQLQENQDSICPVPLRPDLLSVLDDAKAWVLRVIKAGETNVKGYLLISLVVAQVKGLIEGLGEERFSETLRRAVEDVAGVCLPILEGLLNAQEEVDMSVESLTNTADGFENWNFMGSKALFDFEGVDSTSWMFNDINMDMF